MGEWNRYVRWTSSEDDIVRNMLAGGAKNWQIADELHRSVEAVKTRISRLGISPRPEVGARLARARERARRRADYRW